MQRESRALCLLAIVLLLFPALVQAGNEVPVLPGAKAWDMRSEASGRHYRIFTAEPQQPPPPEGYPVIYVLDGNTTFGTAVDVAGGYARRPDGPPALVVGIGYPEDLDPRKERTFDLTPSITADPPEGAGTGGAEDFLRFIEQELKPEIAARFPVDEGQETLFGHSLGGLFTLYALVNDPASFAVFAASSPSIWFEDRFLQQPQVRGRLVPKLQATQAVPRVLITVGEREQPSAPATEDERRNAQRAQVDNAREFAAFLDALPGVASEFVVFADEDHGSVKTAAVARAVRFALEADAALPAPAPPLEAPGAPGGVPVPTAGEYLAFDAEQRYALRLRMRALPEEARAAWTQAFNTSLSAGLTYRQHRLLHEERVAMDEEHGTRSPDRN